MIVIKSHFGKLEEFDEFLVINMDSSYNVLLDKTWMHKNVAVSSRYH